MKVYGVIYGTKVIGFTRSQREADLTALEYGAKIGPDEKHTRQRHFSQWMKLHGEKDEPAAWGRYLDGLGDDGIGSFAMKVPLRWYKTLMCLGLSAIQDDIVKGVEKDPKTGKATVDIEF
jgi:hypothetical protein